MVSCQLSVVVEDAINRVSTSFDHGVFISYMVWRAVLCRAASDAVSGDILPRRGKDRMPMGLATDDSAVTLTFASALIAMFNVLKKVV